MKKLLLLFVVSIAITFLNSCSDSNDESNNENTNQNNAPSYINFFGKYKVYASSKASNPINTYIISSNCLSNWTIEFKTDKTFIENKPTSNPCQNNIRTGTYTQIIPDSILTIKYSTTDSYGWPAGFRIYKNTTGSQNNYDFKLIRYPSSLNYPPYDTNYYLKKL